MRRVEHRVQAKTTKKVVLRLECTVCKYKMQLALKRCKQCVSSLFIECLLYSRACSFELGGEKKTKGAALTFVRVLSLILSVRLPNRVHDSEPGECLLYVYAMYPSPTMTETKCTHSSTRGNGSMAIASAAPYFSASLLRLLHPLMRLHVLSLTTLVLSALMLSDFKRHYWKNGAFVAVTCRIDRLSSDSKSGQTRTVNIARLQVLLQRPVVVALDLYQLHKRLRVHSRECVTLSTNPHLWAVS